MTVQSAITGGQCEGSGSTKLVSPLALADLEMITPQGRVSGNHVTPTDHQYWQSVGVTYQTAGSIGRNAAEPDRFKIFAPADGYIVHIEQFPDSDYRFIIEHSCTFYTIFIHVDKLSDKILSEAQTEGGRFASSRIPVKAGEVIASIGYHSFDFSVHDTQYTLKGLLIPEHYSTESWKIYTVDPFDYFEEPLKSQLKSKSLRTTEPVGGKIDYDIDGKLVGNWFVETTN